MLSSEMELQDLNTRSSEIELQDRAVKSRLPLPTVPHKRSLLTALTDASRQPLKSLDNYDAKPHLKPPTSARTYRSSTNPRSIIQISKSVPTEEDNSEQKVKLEQKLQADKLQNDNDRLKTEQKNYQLEIEKLADKVNQLASDRDQIKKEKYELEVAHRTELSSYNNRLMDFQNEYRAIISAEVEKERSRWEESLQQRQNQHELETKSLREQFEQQTNSINEMNLLKMENLKHELANRNQQLLYDFEKQRIESEKHQSEKIKSLEETIQHNHQEKSSLLSQLEALQNKLNIDNVHLNEQQNQINILESTLSQLKEATQSHQSTSQTYQSTIQQLQFEHSTMQSQLHSALEQTALIKQKLVKEEMVRRKLHNQIQELKGNIRVFCRIRPSLSSEEQKSTANMSFPDEDLEGQQLFISEPASNKVHQFSFDKVFPPISSNEEIFEEVASLVQSALDGYNVCIFAYGQTGSGKTYTMSAHNGMIPKAVDKIFETAESLAETGWKYEITGEFLEIYNEKMIDLLNSANQTDKLEIRHDTKLQKTTITNLTSVKLDSPSTVHSVLRKAANNRSVAATSANERSSRSHSVFILRITGENLSTGKRCEGTLNLIDLAGSERLAHSQTIGIRLKETQSINKSLSYLGDVISALGEEDKSHIPYRNSKLTYLLQYSLSGHSKTLMFVNISPLEPHVNESLSSLRFATKVNNTKIK